MGDTFVIKKAVSLTLAFSFLVMSLTGIMLFIVPQGKIAYWSHWTMFGLTKTQYGNLHITSMFLFLAAGVWHIYFNWKPLLSYVKNSVRRVTLLKKELLLALALNTLFVAGTLAGIPPLQSIIALNDQIKAYWERSYGSPPFGHAEESSLSAFSRYIGVETETALSRLKAAGITVDSADRTLQEIAGHNGISAQKVYDAIKPQRSGTAQPAITSLGRRTLGELADMKQIDLEKALHYLKAKGFDATAESRMREAANAVGMTPYELFETLKAL